jgi:hypothetical protein
MSDRMDFEIVCLELLIQPAKPQSSIAARTRSGDLGRGRQRADGDARLARLALALIARGRAPFDWNGRGDGLGRLAPELAAAKRSHLPL